MQKKPSPAIMRSIIILSHLGVGVWPTTREGYWPTTREGYLASKRALAPEPLRHAPRPRVLHDALARADSGDVGDGGPVASTSSPLPFLPHVPLRFHRAVLPDRRLLQSH